MINGWTMLLFRPAHYQPQHVGISGHHPRLAPAELRQLVEWEATRLKELKAHLSYTCRSHS